MTRVLYSDWHKARALPCNTFCINRLIHVYTKQHYITCAGHNEGLLHGHECDTHYMIIMIIITTLIYTLVRNITNTHKSENIGCSRNRTCDLSITCRARYPCATQPIDQTPYVCLYTKLSRLYYNVNYSLLLLLYTVISTTNYTLSTVWEINYLHRATFQMLHHMIL